MSETTSHRPRPIFPGLQLFYHPVDAAAETVVRVLAGGLLATHGFSRISNPFGAVGYFAVRGSNPVGRCQAWPSDLTNLQDT